MPVNRPFLSALYGCAFCEIFVVRAGLVARVSMLFGISTCETLPLNTPANKVIDQISV